MVVGVVRDEKEECRARDACTDVGCILRGHLSRHRSALWAELTSHANRISSSGRGMNEAIILPNDIIAKWD